MVSAGGSQGTSSSSSSSSVQAAQYTGPQGCVLAVRGDSPVARACREGGIRSAKSAMKTLVTQSRANGVPFQCDDCHVNTDTFSQLGPGANEKFNRLLTAAGAK